MSSGGGVTHRNGCKISIELLELWAVGAIIHSALKASSPELEPHNNPALGPFSQEL